MKYFSGNVSIVTVRRRDGYWATLRQAQFLAEKLRWLFGDISVSPASADELVQRLHSVNSRNLSKMIADYLRGDRLADVSLRKQLTAAEYRIVSEVASYLAIDNEGSNAPDAYLAIDLNTGRNLVLRPR